jgi:murein DD-endopeptidase MepM/ murein hydrolase activator NlpD
MRVRWRHRPIFLALGSVVLASLACMSGDDEGLEPEIPFAFAAPATVVVQKGETLSIIAEREGCSVDELMTWNQLESDRLEVGQALVMWNTGSGERATPKDGSDRTPKVAAAPRPAPAARPAPATSWNPLRALVGGGSDAEEVEDDGVAAADGVRVVEPPPAEEPQAEEDTPRRPFLVRGAGVLGVDLGDGDGSDLEQAAAGMEKRGSDLESSGLDRRGGGLGGGGEADTFEVEGRAPGAYGGVMIPDTPVSAPRLARPAAKRCLRGPSEGDLQGDHDAVTNRGLDDAQIRTGMSKVVRASPQCFPKGTSGSYEVVVELEVGCDGVTDDARVISAGPVPGHVTRCIEQTMQYAGFAAHGRPNGVVFQYPLKYSF